MPNFYCATGIREVGIHIDDKTYGFHQQAFRKTGNIYD